MNEIRHPLRRHFDGADAQLGELLHHAVENHRVKTADDDQLGDAKRLAAEHFIDREVADTGMDTDRHVESARFFVEREEIRIVQGVMGLDAAYKYRARA